MYCHGKDHIKTDCPKPKKKDQGQKAEHSYPPPPVAAVEKTLEGSSELVVCVRAGNSRKIIADDSIVNILNINGISCISSALIDTSSSISFISASAFKKFFGLSSISLEKSSHLYKALNSC